MAREAGLIDFRDAYSAEHVSVLVDSLEPFAALVAAAEREACAQIADAGADDEDPYCCGPVADGIAADIRARGEAA